VERHNREKVSWERVLGSLLAMENDRQCAAVFGGEFCTKIENSTKHSKGSTQPRLNFAQFFLMLLDHNMFFSDSRESSLFTVFIFGLHRMSSIKEKYLNYLFSLKFLRYFTFLSID
jgi:hypothetical protein